MAGSGASPDGGGGNSAAMVSGEVSSEPAAGVKANILHQAFGRMPQIHVSLIFILSFQEDIRLTRINQLKL